MTVTVERARELAGGTLLALLGCTAKDDASVADSAADSAADSGASADGGAASKGRVARCLPGRADGEHPYG